MYRFDISQRYGAGCILYKSGGSSLPGLRLRIGDTFHAATPGSAADGLQIERGSVLLYIMYIIGT
jgi:hypothetical protein